MEPFPQSQPRESQPRETPPPEKDVVYEINVGTVETLPPDSEAYVRLSPDSDKNKIIFDFGIPQGASGANGLSGSPGAAAPILNMDALSDAVVKKLPPITITIMDDVNEDGVYTDEWGNVVATKSSMSGNINSEVFSQHRRLGEEFKLGTMTIIEGIK